MVDKLAAMRARKAVQIWIGRTKQTVANRQRAV